MALPDPDTPAKLFRSRAAWREEMHLYPMEEIGWGTLTKMVRLALSDPDEALWAYSIEVAGQSFAGEAIRRLSRV